MDALFIDAREEGPALRRASILLERLRQDDDARDQDIVTLEAGVCAIRRAVLAGRLVHSSAIERLEALLDRIAPVVSDDRRDLLRYNAIVETRELLHRLTAGHPRTPVAFESASELPYAR
jgi:hypothetical protein